MSLVQSTGFLAGGVLASALAPARLPAGSTALRLYSTATYEDGDRDSSRDRPRPSRLRKIMEDKSQRMRVKLANSASAANDALGNPPRDGEIGIAEEAGTSTSARTYKPPTPPTGVPLAKLLSNTFPLTYSESFEQWKQRKAVDVAEASVLSHLPFFPEPDATRSARRIKTPVNAAGDFVNEFEITRTVDKGEPRHLVVLHGYGAGLAYFYKNFDAMASQPGWKVHALDLLGYGRSSRPKMTLRAKNPVEGVLKAEAFFADAIEAWRAARGIEKFTLVAHSLGAYIGTSYAARFPHRVDRFMLVSPAGVPRSVFSIPEEEIPESERSPLHPSIERAPIASAVVPPWFKYLWECHWSPFSLVRNTGPLGAKFVSGWSSRRFANLPPSEADALHRYSYGIFNSPGSGEYALNFLLAPGGHGRWPLAERAHRIPCPSIWVYGDRDWMDVRGGRQAASSIRSVGGRADVVTIPDAGHHIYLDNPEALNDLITQFMQDAAANR